ncbi:MAG: hypothetical protein Q7S19_03140 [bacterium]|nr:hypothetical protein [bacterium]
MTRSEGIVVQKPAKTFVDRIKEELETNDKTEEQEVRLLIQKAKDALNSLIEGLIVEIRNTGITSKELNRVVNFTYCAPSHQILGKVDSFLVAYLANQGFTDIKAEARSSGTKDGNFVGTTIQFTIPK